MISNNITKNSPSQIFNTGAVNKKLDEKPFKLKWLARHFNFNVSDVEKSGFDTNNIGLMFEVCFKAGKDDVAKQFYNTLISRGASPTEFNYDKLNYVFLSKYNKDKILAAGYADDVKHLSKEKCENISKDIFFPKMGKNQSESTILDNLTIDPYVKFKIQGNEKLYTREYFSEHFDVNPEDIEKMGFEDSIYLHISFRKEAVLEAIKLGELLNKRGCTCIIKGNEISLSYDPQKIISAASGVIPKPEPKLPDIQINTDKPKFINFVNIDNQNDPFNIHWLKINCNLDDTKVTGTQFKHISNVVSLSCPIQSEKFMSYSIQFEKNEISAPRNYGLALKQQGIPSSFDSENNIVEITLNTESVKEKLTQCHVERDIATSSISSSEMQELKIFIEIIEQYINSLNSASVFMREEVRTAVTYGGATGYSGDMIGTRLNYHYMHRFQEDMKSKLEMTQQLFLDPRLVNQLNCYFIFNENGFKSFQYFIDNSRKVDISTAHRNSVYFWRHLEKESNPLFKNL
ncbi:MAG: hypothetical protein H0U49_06600 [Parachlamydiaceae bacterium]|nr:hypothetical protein [Parachlamydiaceae bacterium]